VTLSLIAAISGALLYGVASVMQAVAVRRTGGLRALRHPLYLAGLACDGVAWIASLLALNALPLFTVQAILAGALAVTVVLARLVLAAALRWIDVAAVAVAVAALGVLALAAGPDAGGNTAASAGFVATTLVGLGLLTAAAALTYRRGHGMWFAGLAGLASTGAAISARAAHLAMPSGAVDLMATAKQPLVGAIVSFGVLTVVTYARSLERAEVGPATAVVAVVDVMVPAAIGLAVLGDTVRGGWAPAAAVATAFALVAAVVLAMSPATTAAQGSQLE